MENLEIKYVPIDTLKEYENNAKLHPEEHVAQIVASILEFGFNDPIGITEDGTILEGHGRLLAAKQMGLTEVPVIRLDHLIDDQKKAYILAHNKLTLNTNFDFDKLKKELDSLSENYDLKLTGFSTDEIDAITEDTSDIDLDDFFKDNDGDIKLRKNKKTYICPHCNKSFEA